MATQKKTALNDRLVALDLLRGFFVVNIVNDHLWRFPSLFGLLSGQGRLWVSSAEGFVMISGLLIGYIRGYRNRELPFKAVAKKLLVRAAILYIAMVVASCVYIAIEWSDVVRSMPYTPTTPDSQQYWGVALTNVLTLTQPHTWVHFLALYSIFLCLAVGAVWLLRKGRWWAVLTISVITYSVGEITSIEWMKWQLLFFGPSIVGFYLESVRAWWRQLAQPRQRLIVCSLSIISVATVSLSVMSAYYPDFIPSSLQRFFTSAFDPDAMTPFRIVLASIWFATLAILFHKGSRLIQRATGGILEYLGSHSLQTYIVHGLFICLAILVLPDSSSWIINTLYGLVVILAIWAFIRLPVVRRIVPR